ncbi:MAG: CAP domain-containing protein [Anaerolineaceae bacterium]
MTNAYRVQHGLGTLAISTGLNRASAWMVNDMATKGYFSHTDSLGRDPWTRLGDCGNPTYGGENLAAGTERGSASAAFELLKSSPSHNAVMLSPEFRLIGIARQFAAGSTYGWYWATDFGNGDATVEAAAPPPVPVVAAATASPAPVPHPMVVSAPPTAPVVAPIAPAPQPEPAADPEPEPVTIVAIPLKWEGDDQLAAAMLGSLAGEFGQLSSEAFGPERPHPTLGF